MEIQRLYAIQRNGCVTGVFTREEAARKRRADAVEPILVPCLPSSSAMSGYVAMARGSWTTVSMTAEGVQSESFRPGPCWGANVQTAIAGLFAPGGDLAHGCVRRRITLTHLRLYELDRDYGAACPENLHLIGFAGRIAACLRMQDLLTEDLLGEDFLALYLRLMQRRRERKESNRSPLPDLLTERLLSIACQRAPGKRGFCGTYLRRVADSLKNRITRSFTLQEMRLLSVLLKLPTSETAAPQTIPQSAQDALLARLEALVPHVRRTTGLRHDDEDPDALAHFILHPEEMFIEGAEIDCPDS